MTGSNEKEFTVHCNELNCDFTISFDYTWIHSKSKVTGCCSELQDPDEYDYDIDAWDVDVTFYDNNGNTIIGFKTTPEMQKKIRWLARNAIDDYMDNLTWDEVVG